MADSNASDNQPSCSYAISDSDDDSCVELAIESITESPPTPKKAKTSKFKGAVKYKTKFNPDWKKEFPFITSVAGDPYKITYS